MTRLPFIAAVCVSLAMPVACATDQGDQQPVLSQAEQQQARALAEQRLSQPPQQLPADASPGQPEMTQELLKLGSKSPVSGEITKIEGEYFFIKDAETEEAVRVRVTKDTNRDCGPMTSPSSAGQQEAEKGKDIVSESQQSGQNISPAMREQGQKADETAVGRGFKIGACAFKFGDKVKAEVDDNGIVTTLKLMTDEKKEGTAAVGSEGPGTSVIPQPDEPRKPEGS